MYCRLLLKLILRDKAVWICTLVLAAAFSVPIAFNSPIYGPFFMKQGMQSFVDAFNTRAPQASGTDLSPEQQNDAELARYANAALAAQTDAAFLDSAESYYALMGEGFQSGSIVGDQETNDAALAYCRALSSSGITDIPASANDLPFLSFLPYAIATAPSFLPFIPFLLSSILVLGATRPATLAAKAPVPKFRRLIQIVFSIIAAGTAMLLAGLAPGGIYALALNGFGQIGYPIAFFHDGALTTTTAGNVFTALLLALLAGGTLISVCSAVISTATRRVLAGPLTSALLVAAPAFPLLSDSALGHNAVLGLLPLPVFSPIEATGYVGCFPTEFIGSGSGSASMLAVALAYVAVFFTVGAVATRSPKQPGPWARASRRERGIRKHDDTFNRVAFPEPGNGGGPRCSQRLGENHPSCSAVGPISHPHPLGKPGGRRNLPTSISRICRTRLPEPFGQRGSLSHAIGHRAPCFR